MKKRLITLITVIILVAMALSFMSGCNKRKGDSSADLQHSAEVIIEKLPSDMFPDNQEPSTPAASSEAAEPAKVKETDYLVLVNKENKLPDGWEDVVKLVKVKNDVEDFKLTKDQDYIRDREFEVEEKTYEAFQKLQKALYDKDGIIILLDSTYRSVARQQEIWDEFMEDKGEEYTKKYVAVPGYSEHHTGLAIDICIVVDGKVINDNDEMIAQDKIFAKIHKRLAKYGFILRYPEGMEEITGYSYEPWHLRYVGKDVAKAISDREWTLEQYLRSGATD